MAIPRRTMLLAAGMAAANAPSARTQPAAWPTRPLSLIIPWAPGGGTDLVFRAMAPLLSERLGQPVAVLNRPGGNGTVGHMAIRTAVPDGTSFGAISAQLLTSPLLGPSPITWRDLQPLALVNVDAAAITVRADAPWRSLGEFIHYARRNPEAVRVGNSGPGGTWHIAALELERHFRIRLTHSPYAGAAPGLRDLLGGHIEAVAFSAVEAKAQVESGQARILAVTAPERLPGFPQAPTAIEQGWPIDLGAWRGLALPPGVPAPVLARLQAVVAETVADARFTGFMAGQGFGLRYLDAAGLTNFLAEQETVYRQFFSG
ncbi:ABC transporter substrate-binding protein [Siccirubricoccus deserti]|uniref:Tripartite tricarboxylate transporter substrate binding protein n=1 Tax=Siccirubricoccus deserti TaxID=2013562 RepID=A0A9X0R4S3_9PROT|nr:tripartite tricarboxylate transporter substrate binding protein [Siccirubricoccus deserti]MBC4018483.1 tripartite tricarboxylate transporter substrate binding protein [Siccirubricoccus deserti]GGC65813.1 ABC transporter substrate-binding protein [Siccirubricoccus deserti]